MIVLDWVVSSCSATYIVVWCCIVVCSIVLCCVVLLCVVWYCVVLRFFHVLLLVVLSWNAWLCLSCIVHCVILDWTGVNRVGFDCTVL